MSKKKTATETMMEEAAELRKKYLDSFDERLSRIERRLNLTGTADPYTCCVCGQPAVGGHGTALGARIGYCRLHWPDNTTRTVGECICTHRMLPDPDCPIHGWEAIFKGQKAAYDRLHNIPDPYPNECCGGWYHDKVQCTKPDKCKLHLRKKCTCPNIVDFGCRPVPVPLINKHCPVHGMAGVETFTARSFIDELRGTPTLPLNVRVAKANGHDVLFAEGGCWTMDNKDWPKPVFPWIVIPGYPNDLVAAMGALEEYCKINSILFNIDYGYFGKASGYWVRMGRKPPFGGYFKSLPQAICLAIVAHSEQQ